MSCKDTNFRLIGVF